MLWKPFFSILFMFCPKQTMATAHNRYLIIPTDDFDMSTKHGLLNLKTALKL